MVTDPVVIFAEASLISWTGDMLSEKTLAAIGAVTMFYLGYIVKKEILPLLIIKRNREVASYPLIIADDVTDFFRLKFLKAHWSIWLDRAVDRIMDITGVSRNAAGGAARAAVVRKNILETKN